MHDFEMQTLAELTRFFLQNNRKYFSRFRQLFYWHKRIVLRLPRKIGDNFGRETQISDHHGSDSVRQRILSGKLYETKKTNYDTVETA